MMENLVSPDLLICAGERREKIALFGREFEIRLISAYDAAVCVASAKELEKRLAAKSVADSEALAHNACLAALCLYDSLGRVFESGDEALLRLTAEELALIVSKYADMRLNDFDIDSVSEDDMERLRQSMAASPLTRIRWKVQKALCRLPSDRSLQRMTDGQYLYCYLNLLIDEAEGLLESGWNENFGQGVSEHD